MQPYPEIKSFVQESLGCSCPEDVFNNIVLQDSTTSDYTRRVNIGDRLLIYIMDASRVSNLNESISNALSMGFQERDENNFNRFRLVVASPVPESIANIATSAFSVSTHKDDKTHLHLVSSVEVENLFKIPTDM